MKRSQVIYLFKAMSEPPRMSRVESLLVIPDREPDVHLEDMFEQHHSQTYFTRMKHEYLHEVLNST